MVAIKKGKQPEISGEIDVTYDCYIDGKVLVIFGSDFKPGKNWILDTACTF